MDFFDIVPDNFFSLLSSKNKRIYLASLLQVFKVYETASILGIDKKVVVDDLIYFLDKNTSYLYDSEDKEDEEANPTNKRELVNYILRRFEECGWIYVDVTNDYVEILNFTDAAITFCQAILNAYPQVEYADEELPDNFFNPNEYQGYIYSIYSLLTQKDNVDYALTFSLVYSDTRQLVRAIRRLDARMKDYIQSVIDNSEIKDLMEKLIAYKNDVYDKSYTRLKISDNIDRYRLDIISRLEEFQSNDVILKAISNNYLHVCKTPEEAVMRANKNIDEIIDAFNALEEFIAEIDNKNRNYINSTIGKIKFLLSEDDNVVGKINRILQYIKQTNKQGKIDKSLTMVEKLYNLPSSKVFDMERSLYQPRGSYQRNYDQLLDDIALDFEPTDEFMAQFKNAYNEIDIMNFLEAHMVDSVFEAKSVINPECDKPTFMMAVYCIILAVEKNYTIEIKDELLQSKDFEVKNYIIKKTI